MNSSSKNTISTFKENFKYILLIPAFLGGVWQLCELLNISTSYIRFFSITQIVPDGLLILFLLLLIYSAFKFSFFMINGDLKKDDNGNTIEEKFSVRRSIGIIIISIGTLIFFGCLFYPLDKNKTTLTELIMLLFLIITIGSSIILALKNIVQVLIKKHPKFIIKTLNSYFIKLILSLCSLHITYLLIVSFSFTLSTFSDTYSFPENLKNIEELNKSIKSTYPKLQNKILYMNDKYVFIELIDKKKVKEHLILEFNDVLFLQKIKK